MRAPEIATIQDIKAAFDAVEAATVRTKRPTRADLRQWQSAIVRFWQTCQRFHAQREGVDVLNDIREGIFKRERLAPEACPRLFTRRRMGTSRSSNIHYPSASRIARAVLTLPGAGNHCLAIARILGADVRNIKALWKLLNEKETRRAVA